MYKIVLGTCFPCGVFEWPPDKWLGEYRERKKRAAAWANEETDKTVMKAPFGPSAGGEAQLGLPTN